MNFFVRHSTGPYDGWSFDEFESEQQVIDFLNANAGNPSFTFEVIQGRKIAFEPVSVATKYRKK